jgi:hypothetical protein
MHVDHETFFGGRLPGSDDKTVGLGKRVRSRIKGTWINRLGTLLHFIAVLPTSIVDTGHAGPVANNARSRLLQTTGAKEYTVPDDMTNHRTRTTQNRGKWGGTQWTEGES